MAHPSAAGALEHRGLNRHPSIMKALAVLLPALSFAFWLNAAPDPVPPFFAFQNGLELPPAQTAATLQELGFDGLSGSGYDVASLLKELHTRNLKLFNTYLIQTLDRGSYDVGAFVRQLRAMGYTAPVGLQCYNLKGDQKENLRRSLAAWRQLSKSFNPPPNKP